MKKNLLLGILLCITISFVSLQSKADTSELKTIENEKYNWKMKVPKCWELYPSFTEKDLRTRHLVSFVMGKCKIKSNQIKGLTIQYYNFSLNQKRMKTKYNAHDIMIGGRSAVAFSSFAGVSEKKEGQKFQAIDWYVLIPCQKGHRELKFRDIFNAKDVDLKKETVKNFPTPLLRKIASTFECT